LGVHQRRFEFVATNIMLHCGAAQTRKRLASGPVTRSIADCATTLSAMSAASSACQFVFVTIEGPSITSSVANRARRDTPFT
jgi:hypothetical protein